MSERELAGLVECLADGVVVVDAGGEVVLVNPAAARMLGRPAADLIGHPIGTELTPGHRIEVRLRRPSGPPVTAEIVVASAEWDGAPVLVATLRDVTDRHRVEGALRDSRERAALLERIALDGVWDWDLERDEVTYSDRWKDMLGLAADGVGGEVEEWLSRVHPHDRDGLQRALDEHLSGQSDVLDHEYRMRTHPGDYRWMRVRAVAASDASDEPYRLCGWQRDVHDRVVAERRLPAAMHDPLTGLVGRVLFRDRLEHAAQQARRRRGHRFAVMVVDLDRFHWANDSLGHAAGDDLLVTVAHRLRDLVRPGDTVARFGGDEFAILLVGPVDAEDAGTVATRVLRSFDAPVTIGGREVVASAAVGLATSDDDPNGDRVLHEADVALAAAKQTGGGQLIVYTPDGDGLRAARLELEQDLRGAVERDDELVVHFQPIVRCSDRGLLGFEALVRWQHPERGLLLPSEFLDVAEQTGLVVPLGTRVLEATARQLQEWNALGVGDKVAVSVNVSARQLAQDDLAATVARVLDEHDVEPRQLCLEITEHVVMAEGMGAEETLADLRATGVRIFSDDFGSGYSGLGYLSRFPVDAVKIDRSFVSQIDRRPGDAAIVEAIVGLCRALDIHVIAEGVETEEQFAMVRRLGCDSAQGFLFAGPLAVDNVVDLAAFERGLSRA